jgi:P-type Ca2+ transporter type 2C
MLHKPFGTFALSAADWLVILLCSGTVLPVLELAKWLVRREVFGVPA